MTDKSLSPSCPQRVRHMRGPCLGSGACTCPPPVSPLRGWPSPPAVPATTCRAGAQAMHTLLALSGLRFPRQRGGAALGSCQRGSSVPQPPLTSPPELWMGLDQASPELRGCGVGQPTERTPGPPVSLCPFHRGGAGGLERNGGLPRVPGQHQYGRPLSASVCPLVQWAHPSPVPHFANEVLKTSGGRD